MHNVPCVHNLVMKQGGTIPPLFLLRHDTYLKKRPRLVHSSTLPVYNPHIQQRLMHLLSASLKPADQLAVSEPSLCSFYMNFNVYKLHKFLRFYTTPSSFASCSMTYIGITKEQNE